jgi:uncharacterized membrane protein YbhN (UPF0104 family)
MLKTVFLTTLKIAVAAGLIYWLLQSGKLDFKLLARLKDHPLEVLIAAVLSVVNFILISYRWRNILRARSAERIPVMGVFKTTWIGQFFSSVLPGSVSGDLVKILYIQKYDPTFSKKFILATIFIDRIIGLCALVLMVGTTSLIFGPHIVENAPAMKPLLNINYLLASGVLIAIVIFTFIPHLVRGIFTTAEKIFFPKIWNKLGNLWDDLVSIRNKMIKGLLISLLVQFIGVLIFWALIYPFVVGKMDFIQALAFIPLGIVTLALPVAPSGLGVGHAIFQKLFEFAGIDNGASLFNLYFVVTLVVNVMGVIPYILSKSETNPSTKI